MTPRPRTIGRVHWRGFATLLGREVRRTLKDWMETLIAPAFSTLVYFTIFALAAGPGDDGPEAEPVLDFLLPGLVLFAILVRAAETTSFSIVFDKLEGILSDILMAPLSPREITAAYALAGATCGLVTGLVIFAGAMLLRPLDCPAPWAVGVFACTGALMLSLWGLLVGLWADKWDHVAAAYTFFLVPFSFISGLFAPISALPPILQAVVALNPIAYAIDGFRYGLLGVATFDPALSLAVVAAAIAVLWLSCGRLIARGYKIKP